ncbi:MAG TPA: PqqD family protein [Pyrinomonadaceae bacterium]|jgi:hypothetical protein|nr:PqqD family protein [Pyrinomonadaceae bacterium]
MIEINAITAEHVVCTEFDQEALLVDLNSKRYYQLNETALLIWKSLEKRRTLDEIVSEVIAGYVVSAEQARVSVERMIRDLRSYRLIESVGTPQGP